MFGGWADPSPFSCCFVAAQVGHLGNQLHDGSTWAMTHVHHQVPLQSNSESATADLQLQNLKKTVQLREWDFLFEE